MLAERRGTTGPILWGRWTGDPTFASRTERVFDAFFAILNGQTACPSMVDASCPHFRRKNWRAQTSTAEALNFPAAAFADELDRPAPVVKRGAIAGLLNRNGREGQAEGGSKRFHLGLLGPFPSRFDLLDVDAVTARVGNETEEDIPALAIEGQEERTEGALRRVLGIQIDRRKVDLPRAALEHQRQFSTIRSSNFRAYNGVPRRATQRPSKLTDLGGGVLHHPAKGLQGGRPAGLVGQQTVRIVGTTVLQCIGIFAKDSVRLLGTGAAARGQDEGGEQRRERSTRARRAKIHDVRRYHGGIPHGDRICVLPFHARRGRASWRTHPPLGNIWYIWRGERSENHRDASAPSAPK